MSLGRLKSLLVTSAINSAYNDMCHLCEKYAPLEGLGKYDTEKDPSVTGLASRSTPEIFLLAA